MMFKEVVIVEDPPREIPNGVVCGISYLTYPVIPLYPPPEKCHYATYCRSMGLVVRGEILTNQISGKNWDSPNAPGHKVYFNKSGQFVLYRCSKCVGICLKGKDSEGYVTISFKG